MFNFLFLFNASSYSPDSSNSGEDLRVSIKQRSTFVWFSNTPVGEMIREFGGIGRSFEFFLLYCIV